VILIVVHNFFEIVEDKFLISLNGFGINANKLS